MVPAGAGRGVSPGVCGQPDLRDEHQPHGGGEQRHGQQDHHQQHHQRDQRSQREPRHLCQCQQPSRTDGGASQDLRQRPAGRSRHDASATGTIARADGACAVCVDAGAGTAACQPGGCSGQRRAAPVAAAAGVCTSGDCSTSTRRAGRWTRCIGRTVPLSRRCAPGRWPGMDGRQRERPRCASARPRRYGNADRASRCAGSGSTVDPRRAEWAQWTKWALTRR